MFENIESAAPEKHPLFWASLKATMLGILCFLSSNLSFPSDYDSMVEASLGGRWSSRTGRFGGQFLFRNCIRH